MVVVVIVIVMALLIHGCESNATENSLKTYNANVYRLISRSNTNGGKLLQKLTGGNLSSDSLSVDLAKEAQAAKADLRDAERLNAPSQMAAAQTGLVEVMQLRARATETIAKHAQSAASKSTSTVAVKDIATGTSMLYGSDVVYKAIVAPDLARALNHAGIPIGSGGGDEQPINGAQILPDLGWLQTTWIADKIGAQLSTTAANANNAAPGLHGHSLNAVSVGGTTLVAGGTNNTLPAGTKTFTLNVTNGGDYPEYRVECKVSVENMSDVGESTIAETTSQEVTNVNVSLATPLSKGVYTVIATVAKVPGEKNTDNNSLTYTITVN